MLELRGKYNTAKIFTDNIDTATVSQVQNILNQEFVKNSQIRIMPDCHAGKGCVIGTTMTLKDKVIPNLVGVDIGCGMSAYKLNVTSLDYALLDRCIRQYIPSGCSVRENIMGIFSLFPRLKTIESSLYQLKANVNIDNALKSIGTLGGGNHFIEIDRDKNGDLWLVVHSGSRHLGLEVCSYYQDKSYEILKEKANHGSLKEKSDALIKEYKKAGRQKEINIALKKLVEEYSCINLKIQKEYAYCEDELFNDYIHDMHITQQYASVNRKGIAETILYYMNIYVAESFETVHNYIDCKNMILRKGSVSAQKNEKIIIPMNMRDGSLICIGKGNPDWNYSAPHGAGRILSRSEAKNKILLEDFKKSMDGIYTSSVNQSTIDESPFVYKPIEEIIENIQETVSIIDIIKPEYNFKASE